MSLNTSLITALSSISVLEQQMGVASNNIANASVSGYTEKTVTLATSVSNGQASGVLATGVSSSADSYLLQDIAQSLSASSAASTNSSYYTSLDNIIGSLSSTSSSSSTTTTTGLASSLSTLQSDLSSLATTPDNSSLKESVVNDLDTVASELRDTSSSVQALRTQADQQISTDVTTVNSTLDSISQYNTEIVAAKAAGQSTADLEDERSEAIQTLSSYMNISYYTDSSGSTHIFTGSTALVDGTTVNHLSHTAAADMSSSTSYPSDGISGITVAGQDITTSITSGSIGALINQRDTVLPQVQSELDSLASGLSSTINAATNQGGGTSDTLTGDTDVATTDAVSVASGTTLRVASLGSDGTVAGFSDIDISGAATVGDIIDDINAVSGTSGVTASLSSSGTLELTSTSGTTVAVSTLSGSVGGTDVSSYFGLNDALTGGNSAATIAVNASLLSTPANFPTGVLSTSSTLAVGDSGIASGDATVATTLEASLSASQSFSAAGKLAATSSTLTDYASSIISSLASDITAASTKATTTSNVTSTLQTQFSNDSGVNVDTETAKLTQLQDLYSSSAQIITTEKAMFSALLTAVEST